MFGTLTVFIPPVQVQLFNLWNERRFIYDYIMGNDDQLQSYILKYGRFNGRL